MAPPFNVLRTNWQHYIVGLIGRRLNVMSKGSGSGKKYRSAGTGRFVTPGYAGKHPKTTVGEARGGGSSGKFVKSSYASRNKSTTIRDN